MTRGVFPFLFLAACSSGEPSACVGFADRELGITSEEYSPCAAAILATLDSLRPRLQALVAGDEAVGRQARPHYRALQAMIEETGIPSDYRSTQSSTVIVKWPEASMRAFNSAAFEATVQYGAVLAYPNDDNFQQGCGRRRRRGVHTARFIEARATTILTRRTLVACIGLVACIELVACSSEPAAPLPVGSSLRIGSYTLTIQRVQPAPKPGPPVSSFREQPSREGVMVFTSWSGLDALDPMSRIAFAEKYLEDRLAVIDSTGERYEPTAAMQAALLFMNDPGDNWRDWIVLFHLPEEGGGWILEVENPEPAAGQPNQIAVDLGS